MDRFLRTNELVLRVVELSEAKTIGLLCEIPFFKSLITRHGKSIVREKHRDYLLAPGHGGSPACLIYDFVSRDREPSAPQYRPALTPVLGWESVKVAEKREHEIEILLNAPYFRIRPAPSAGDFTWPLLNASAKLKLRDMLKRALYQTDVIRDMEAKAVISLGVPATSWGFHPGRAPFDDCPLSTPDLIQIAKSTPEFQRLLSKELVPIRMRRLQTGYLRSLSDADLIGLYALCRIAVESWHEVRMLPAHKFGNEESTLFEKELSFKETVLRHGSWFLYGEVRGFGARANHRRDLLDYVHHETTKVPSDSIDFELSLVGTMHELLMKRLDVSIRKLEKRVLRLVEDMIGADGPAFEEPASARGHGSAAL